MKAWPRMFIPIALGMVLSGCGQVQSALAPQGPAAARIAVLAGVLFAVAAAVFAIVLIALWIAIRGAGSLHSALGQTRAVVAGGIVLPIIVLSALLIYGTWLTHAAVPAADERDALRIEVVGEQWWWRVIYTAPNGEPVASANELRLPVGRAVDLVLSTADVIHSFWVPNLAGKVDMIPGRVTRLRLVAERPGIARGQCAEYCGGPHALMALHAIAMEPGEYERWLASLSAAAAEPTTSAARQGQELFLSAGCGGCHAIRGTPASGKVGPDLTHVAGRTSLAAAVMPNTKTELIRWIRDGQHIKPANRMPPFRNLSDVELENLATYLATLR